MKSKKRFFSFINDNKKKAGLLVMLILCIGVYTAFGGISKDKTVNDDIPLHDGDVLVDSLNVKEETGGQEPSPDESALVTSDDVAEPENPDAYFQELRATLDLDRNKIISMLSDAESSAATSAEKKEASEEKLRLLNYMEQEATIEALISNKGLPDCFVVISENGVNVTVNTEELDQPTVTKICEIIMRQTNIPADEIVVQDIS